MVKPDLNFGKFPLYFIANNGQVDKRAKFYAKASRYTLWLTRKGLVFDSFNGKRDVSRLLFLHASKDPEMAALEETRHRVNYFKGNDPSKWRGNIPTSRAVLYKGLYKHIDLKVYGIEKQVEYDWIVKPGGNPTHIRFEYQNVKGARLDKEGNLHIETECGRLVHKKPVAYQNIETGKRIPVEVAFKKTGEHGYGFKVGKYDKRYELIIDPVVLAYSTYLGDSVMGNRCGIDIDGDGNIYVTGNTQSPDFPVMNRYQGYQGNYDVFITKIDPTQSPANQIIYSTYLGGSEYDEGCGMKVDGNHAYVTGFTNSSNFPTLNPFQTDQPESDAFVTVLDTSKSGAKSLIYSTYLGGDGDDSGYAIALDEKGVVYVAGETKSADFPVLNPFQGYQGENDAFITKLDTTQNGSSGLLYSTYIGGESWDSANGIAADRNGNAYITGFTFSGGFPVIDGFQTDADDVDAFVSKIDTNQAGTASLLYSTYLGGRYADFGYAIAVTNNGHAYVTGATTSDDFPVLDPYQVDPGDLHYDAFVTGIDTNRAGTAGLLYSSYLGGDEWDSGKGIALGHVGEVYVVGDTRSTDFPTKDEYQVDPGDNEWDVFVLKLDTGKPGAAGLVFSTYLGGQGGPAFEFGRAIAVDKMGNAYMTGLTTSTDFPLVNPFQETHSGSAAFVSKLFYPVLPVVETAPASSVTNITAQGGGEVTYDGGTNVTARGVCWSTETNPDLQDNFTDDGTGAGTFDSSLTGLTPNTVYYVRAYATNAQGTAYGHEEILETEEPYITVTSPNGREAWEAGSPQAITWDSKYVTGEVDIAYSTDGGQTWSDIAISTGNDGSYPWNVPDVSSSECLIHISETNDGPFDVSDGLFTIFQPSITVISPDGGEAWAAGSRHDITWISTGSVGNVKIECSPDSGQSWYDVELSTPNDGSYPWDVPGIVSNQCLMRISEEGGSPSDVSNGLFSIVESTSVTVLYPNGGETLDVGSICHISWASAGSIDDVELAYSTDNGDNWTHIISSTPNAGSYAWTVPNAVSTFCRVRVTDVGGNPSDISDNVFSIQTPPSITVTSPNGGEKLNVGDGFDIAWTSQGTASNVSIQYSVTNGKLWRTITDSTANDGGFDWTVPDAPSDKCLVRVSAGDPDGGYSDVSDAVFSIVSPIVGNIVVTSPNGGEELAPGSVHLIQWTSQSVPEVPFVTIRYSTDRGVTWGAIAASVPNAASGVFEWTVPNTPSTHCIVEISAIDKDLPASDRSNRQFTILNLPSPSLTVISPNGGETFVVNDQQPITWTSTGSVGSVEIYYSTNDGNNWTEITPSTPNDGSFDWTIPDTPSAECLVRIKQGEANVQDTSDGLFSIVPSASLTVTSPNGGEQCEAGSNQDITWTSTGIVGEVGIEYSFDGGNSWSLVNGTAPNTGAYDWTVPDTPSDSCLVRILGNDTDPQGPLSDESDTAFTITAGGQASLTLTSPNGNELWFVDGVYPITWTSVNVGGNVTLDYSPDGGDNWTGIAESTENDGSYDWTVPDDPSANCLVRVRVIGGPLDVGDSVFTIMGASTATLTVVSPNGSEALLTGSSAEIKWDSTGTVNTVGLDYSSDGGGAWSPITASTPDDGIFNWTVPDTPSNHCLVRVVGTDGDWDGAPWDVSDDLFAIISPIAPAEVRVVFPNGGETWETGAVEQITWSSTGNFDNLAIDYSTDNGISWAAITASTPDTGSYDWDVPYKPSDQCLVRVRAGLSDSDDEVSDISDAVFSIVLPAQPVIIVQTPNGGESLYQGYPYDITWTSSGFDEKEVVNITIEFSSNGGDSWQEVVASTDNDGVFEWTVPSEISSQCLVRVKRDSGQPLDISDAVFSIITAPPDSITVTDPNGGEQLNGGIDHTIKWDSAGNIANVKVEYSLDDGATWIEIAASAENDHSFGWSVPSTPSEDCRVRITAITADGDTGPSDTSDGAFSIITPDPVFVRVQSPNAAEQLTVGGQFTITWNSSGLTQVLIEYSTDDGDNWQVIDTADATEKQYDWTVPNTPSTQCLVRITGNDGGSMPSDVSDAVFSIIANSP
jgi:hypothetical protein